MALYMGANPARTTPRIRGIWQHAIVPIEIKSCCSMFVHREFRITFGVIIMPNVIIMLFVMTNWNATAVLRVFYL